MTVKNPGAKREVYRLALYGVRASGKTCILSALALPRVPNHQGYTATWIENIPDHPLPPGNPAEWKTRDPYHDGWQWLTEQRLLLQKGEVPNPNSNRSEALRYQFDFGAPDQGSRLIELIDYSGELIKGVGVLAGKLQEHMRECDGLLILAEVTYPGKNQDILAEDLENLKGAFSTLIHGKQSGIQKEWPVVILFNKWDRLESFEAEKEKPVQELVEKFLRQSPPPPQVGLVDVIRNTVGKENMQCFPVTAFGKHDIRNDGVEVPVLDGALLKSRWLEDGFIWAANRSDETMMVGLEKAEQATSWFLPQILYGMFAEAYGQKPSSWRGVNPMAGFQSSWSAGKRLPSDKKYRARRARRSFAGKFCSQLAVLVMGLLVCLLLGEGILDSTHYKQVFQALGNPQSIAGEIETAEKWLYDYHESTQFRHILYRLFLTKKQALEMAIDNRNRRDDTMWEVVNGETEPTAKAKLARDYLEKFPAGNHQVEATAIIENVESKIRVDENLAYLGLKEKRIAAVGLFVEKAEDKVIEIIAELENIPHKNTLTELVKKRKNEVLISGNKRIEEIKIAQMKTGRDKLIAQYDDFMRDDKIVEAARILNQNNIQLASLEPDFSKRALTIQKKKIDARRNNNLFAGAGELLDEIRDQAVVKLIDPKKWADFDRDERTLIHKEQDKHLYGQVVQFKPRCKKEIDLYLKNAPLKTMEKEINQYKDYLDKIGVPQDLTLTIVQVEWGEKFKGWIFNGWHQIIVTSGNQNVGSGALVSNAGKKMDVNAKGLVKIQVEEKLDLKLKIDTTWGPQESKASGGEANWSGIPSQLAQGVNILLKDPLNPVTGWVNTVTLKLTGLPVEPELPAWRQP